MGKFIGILFLISLVFVCYVDLNPPVGNDLSPQLNEKYDASCRNSGTTRNKNGDYYWYKCERKANNIYQILQVECSSECVITGIM